MGGPESRQPDRQESSIEGAGLAGTIRSLILGSPDIKPEQRVFVLIAGVLAILLLGVLLFSNDAATTKWATAGVLMAIFAITFLIFLLSLASGRRSRESGDYEARRKAADSVNGQWWQIILVSGENGEVLVEGLTVVNIRLYVSVGSYGLDGELFDSAGKSKAQWRADAVAIKSLAPVELFYRFQGYSFRGPVLSDPTGDVTGIGVFSFEGTVDAESAHRGSGWFATGYVEKLTFGRRRDVRLVRVTGEEKRVLDGSEGGDDPSVRESLIANRFTQLGGRFGTAMGSRWD